MLAKCFPKGLFPTTRARAMKGHRLMCDCFHKQTVRDQKWLYNPHSREPDIDLKGKRGIAGMFSTQDAVCFFVSLQTDFAHR